MERLTNSIKAALDNRNWYAALALALTMPDICGKLDHPDMASSRRYPAWFDQWLSAKYTAYVGPARERVVLLSGNDCYALRCSYLHQGADEISGQRCRDVLSSFHFCEPERNNIVHNNQVTMGDGSIALQLQVDIFCADMIDAVHRWLDVQSQDLPDRMADFLRVWPHPFAPQ